MEHVSCAEVAGSCADAAQERAVDGAEADGWGDRGQREEKVAQGVGDGVLLVSFEVCCLAEEERKAGQSIGKEVDMGGV